MKRKRHVKNKQNIEIQTEIQARTYAFGIVFYNRAGKTPQLYLRRWMSSSFFFTILCDFLTSFPKSEPY